MEPPAIPKEISSVMEHQEEKFKASLQKSSNKGVLKVSIKAISNLVKGLVKKWSWKPTSSELLAQVEARILKETGLQFEQKMVHTENHDINTIILGSGPPLVLLHGFAAGLAFWASNLKEFTQHHTVYAIDLPGFGRSSRNPFDSNTPEEAEDYFINSIELWRREIQLEKFSLLGHSFGGYLASAYALHYPQNVEHLILADPWGIPRQPEQNAYAKMPLKGRIARRAAAIMNPLSAIRAAGPIGPGLIALFRHDLPMKFKHFISEKSLFAKYIYHINAQFPSGEVAFVKLNKALGFAANPMIDRLPDLHNNVPVTLFFGEVSWIDRVSGHQLKELLGDRASIHIVPKAGHHIYVDNHPFFNSTVLERSRSVGSLQSICSAMEESDDQDLASSKSFVIKQISVL